MLVAFQGAKQLARLVDLLTFGVMDFLNLAHTWKVKAKNTVSMIHKMTEIYLIHQDEALFPVNEHG